MGALKAAMDSLRVLLNGTAATINNDTVKIGELFGTNKALLVYFPRRFGCQLCRNFSKGLSELKPEFEKLGVRIVAIGFDVNGVQEFVQGQYWTGDLYLDKDKRLHKDLSFKRGSILDMFKKKLWKLSKEASKNGVEGNFKGDGFQLGGTYIITREKILYSHIQQDTADYVDPATVLSACKEALEE